MNVLVTSAGRRTSLVKAFQEAVHKRGGKVYVADASSLAPTLYIADGALRLPLLHERNYLEVLFRLIAENDIALLVPTIDPELILLAKVKAELDELGCRVMISSSRFVEICNDKWLTVREFAQRGIDVPKSWLPDQLSDDVPDQLFVKPRAGSASQHTYATTPDDLESILPRVPNPIIQEELTGREVTVDALLDFEGTPLHYVPRIRIRTVGGESIQSTTIDDDNGLREWLTNTLSVAGQLGAIGAITLQYFETERGPILSEINPRFGGGYPLALAAGAHYPEWILDMVQGKAVSPRLGEYLRGLSMTRYYTEIFLEELLW